MSSSVDFQKYQKTIRSKAEKYPILAQAEEKSGVPKEFIVLGLAALLGLFLILGVGVGSLCNIVGFLYPAFKSFQAIETKTKGDDTQWLVYWVIFAFFSIMETFINTLLYWIPLYFAFKLAFLLWAMLPQFKGAKFLYDNFLKDFLKKNESRIDAAMDNAKKHAGTIGSEFATATADVMGTAATAAAAAANGAKKDT